ncbi:HAD family acid phosphatase [Parendozoicomonas haliclonae]|uniref:Lipoprotein E n=1 Tax=Parendozoicomonas haliclonae TaxID=1960125 RepID=A0A1X7AHD7_9GAMM|nr:HAD family acid phosphatase [Parendozoicomonas haliclonae]SMA41631.1 Lipoprotein E precursor [Parendozoicomonas haliclonae]
MMRLINKSWRDFSLNQTMLFQRLFQEIWQQSRNTLLLLWLFASLGHAAIQTESAEWQDLYRQMHLALLWQQHSDESTALSLQTFNMATDILARESRLAKAEQKKPVLVVDIDDTLINSTAYFAGFLGTNDLLTHERDLLWWSAQPPIPKPGALDFLKQADAMGVDIHYLTARSLDPSVHPATLSMLKQAQFPQTSVDHLHISLSMQKFDYIQQWRDQPPYKLVLTLGDKVSDLGLVHGIQADQQKQFLEQYPNLPGQNALLHTNVVYGRWECITHGNCTGDATDEMQKRHDRFHKLADPFLTRPDHFQPSINGIAGEELGQLLLWNAHAAEYPFITRQVYNRASQYWLNKPEPNTAVIIDIDGTVLVDLEYYAHVFLNDHSHQPLELFHYLATLQLPPRQVPGAKAYLDTVQFAGGEIFYVTNRRAVAADGRNMRIYLLQALARAGYPMPAENHLLMLEDHNPELNLEKARRFQAIEQGTVTGTPVKVVQWIGDSLEDLGLTPEDLAHNNDAPATGKQAELGRSRFLLPYGLYMARWYPRLMKRWYGENWKDVPVEQRTKDRVERIEKWRPAA